MIILLVCSGTISYRPTLERVNQSHQSYLKRILIRNLDVGVTIVQIALLEVLLVDSVFCVINVLRTLPLPRLSSIHIDFILRVLSLPVV